MGALGDPITPKVGEAMVTLLDHRNTRANVEIMGAYDQCFMDCKASHDLGTIDRFECIRACPNGEIFQQKMDFTAPESPENRSQLQAVWHLMWSLTGVPYAMEMDRVVILGNDQPKPPALIALPGGAEAYLRSVAGNLTLSEAVPDEIFSGNELGPLLDLFNIDSEDISGVIEFLSQLFFPDIEYNGVQYKLSARPTPDELTRLFTQDDIIFQTDDGENILDIREPVDAEGYKLADNMADGLFEAEASGLIDAVYPMAKAFSDHDKEHLLLVRADHSRCDDFRAFALGLVQALDDARGARGIAWRGLQRAAPSTRLPRDRAWQVDDARWSRLHQPARWPHDL